MRLDLQAIFAHARKVGNVILTGTEAAEGRASHDLLPEIGGAVGFYVFAQAFGEWVCIDRSWATPLGHGYTHVLDAFHAKASQGGHQPRGITFVQAAPRDRSIAPVVTAGSFHLMTANSEAADTQKNLTLQRALGKYAHHYGRGRRLVFANGDANLHDDREDVYAGSPLTTCWDEIRSWPTTHPPHATIDVIGSYDRDRRVRCVDARSLTDRQVRLHTDHYLIEATYEVRAR